MAAPNGGFSECYTSVCAEHQIQINPHILEEFENAPPTGDITLNLSGRKWQKSVQKLDDNDAFVLSKCLQTFVPPNVGPVTGLDVSYNNITDQGVRHLADLLKGNSALTSLDLRFNCFQGNGVELLAKILEGNRTLSCLKLSGNKFGESGGVALALMLQLNRSLVELELSACGLGIQSIITFSRTLSSNHNLHSFDISRTPLNGHEEYWVDHIANMLTLNRGLLVLHLGMTRLANRGVERLIQGLKVNCTLRYLDLQHNSVSCKGAYCLAEMLSNNPSLDIIDLSFNRLENEGVVHLSKVLSSPSCTLKALSVSWNNIRTEGLLSLAQAVRANPSLNHVNIWGNYLDDPVSQEFQDLIDSERLKRNQTDVTAYELDDEVSLAEVRNSVMMNYTRNSSSATTASKSFVFYFFKRLF